MINPNMYPETYSPNYNTITVDIRGAHLGAIWTKPRDLNYYALFPLVGPVIALYRATMGAADIVVAVGRNYDRFWIGATNVLRGVVEIIPTAAFPVVYHATESYGLGMVVLAVLQIALILFANLYLDRQTDYLYYNSTCMPAILYYDNVEVSTLAPFMNHSSVDFKWSLRTTYSQWVRELQKNGNKSQYIEKCHFV